MYLVEFLVQNHPARSLLAKSLAATMPGCRIVQDPDPEARRSPWRTFRRCLESVLPESTHAVIVQDDATPCPGFADAVERAVAARPGRLLVFYVGGQMPRFRDAVLDACRNDLPWAALEPNHWMPAVSTCWPRHLIEGILEHTAGRPMPAADDEVIGGYLRHIGHVPLATVPSLVEHYDDALPVMGRTRRMPGTERRAACFIGMECGSCVEEIDWTLGPGA